MADFKCGERFRFTPKARVDWIVVRNYKDGDLLAARCDTEIGRKIVEWLDSGRKGDPPNPGQVSSVSRTFSHGELEKATLGPIQSIL